MKILVCGSRDYNNYEKIFLVIEKYMTDDLTIISGGATGADSIAKEICTEYDIKYIEYVAEWSKYGKRAGPIRNSRMLKENPDLVLAFSSRSELTIGTRDTVEKAKRLGIKIKIFTA